MFLTVSWYKNTWVYGYLLLIVALLENKIYFRIRPYLFVVVSCREEGKVVLR